MADLAINFAPQENRMDLDFGSQAAPETQAPGAQGLNVAPLPAAPAGYKVGETTSAGMELDDSFGNKVLNFFVGANTPAGEINTFDKTMLAKRASMLEEAKVRLAIENQRDTHKAAEAALGVINRRAITDGMEFAANVSSRMAGMTPEEMAEAAPGYQKMLGHFHKELADIPDLIAKNPANYFGVQSAMTDNELAPILQPLTKGRTMADIAKDPVVQQVIQVHGKDLIQKIVTRIPEKDMKELRAGNVDQAGFEMMYKKAMADESFGRPQPVDYAFAMHALVNTEYGEERMRHLGVKTYKHSSELSKKEKPEGGDTIAGIKAKEYKKYEDQIAFNETHPGSFTSEQTAHAKKQMGLLLGTESKDQSENPNNSVIQRFRALATEEGIAVENMSDIQKMKDGPVKKHALALWNQAQAEKDKASAASASAVRMGEPHDMNEKPVYKMDKLGNPVRVTTPMTKGEYLSGKGGFTMTADQKEKLGTIDYAEKEGLALFDLADKAYTATSRFGKGAQTAAEKTLSSPLTAWTLSDTHPELKMYVDERNALLGKFSKSLGGEVGVLTNQDIERVIKMFPGAADNEKIRKMKRQAFQRIISLNKRAITKLLTANQGTEFEGTITPEQMSSMKDSKELRAEIEGTLGSMEGIGKQVEEEKVPRGNSLLDDMRKGK